MVMKRALDHVRRTYRQGVREIATWKRTLVPEPENEETTTMEISLGDLMMSGIIPVKTNPSTTIPEDMEPTDFTFGGDTEFTPDAPRED
jgi:hypothetical protein